MESEGGIGEMEEKLCLIMGAKIYQKPDRDAERAARESKESVKE